jgi:hypothetical protein
MKLFWTIVAAIFAERVIYTIVVLLISIVAVAIEQIKDRH